jgi:hypothetical protein
MKTLMLLIAAIGTVIVGLLRPSRPDEEDDDVGLFIGSARPLAAKPQVSGATRRRMTRSR